MLPNHKRKTEYLQFRVSTKTKKIIESGAKICGLGVGDYIRTNMLKIAQNDIDNASVVSLNQREWDNFIAIIKEPFKPNKNLKAAFENLKNMPLQDTF